MTYPSGIVPHLKDDGGFWVPNDTIDLYLPKIGARGLAIYCCLLRASTRWHYPGYHDLAQMLGVSPKKAEQVIEAIRAAGLINDHDLRAIQGAP